MRSWRLAAVLGVATLATVGACSSPAKTDGTPASAPAGSAVVLQVTDVNTAPDKSVIPSGPGGRAYTNNQFYGDQDGFTIIAGALKHVEALTAWHLCAAELHAEMLAQAGTVKAYRDHPQNMPYNLQSSNPKGDEWLAMHETYQNALAAAVGPAGDANIPCITGTPTDTPNWVQVNLTRDGKNLSALISDEDVLQYVGTLESHAAHHNCASQLKASRDKLANQPVATSPNPNGETFSEGLKYGELSTYDAQIEMLKQVPATNC